MDNFMEAKNTNKNKATVNESWLGSTNNPMGNMAKMSCKCLSREFSKVINESDGSKLMNRVSTFNLGD